MRFRTATFGVAAAALCMSAAPAALAADDTLAGKTDRPGHYSFAVIGDIPYGDAQIKTFPKWVDEINAAKPALTFHVGDIKNGSSRCDDGYYQWFKRQVDRFDSPFVLTPGDNEWTDCHRANNGAYDPLGRLAYERSVFFATPGKTMGAKPITLQNDAAAGFPENTRLRTQGLDIAMLHIVGSNDDLQPWTGIGNTTATPKQVAEEKARMADAIRSMHLTFDTAKKKNDRAVVLMLQADMFDGSYTPKWTDISAFKPFIEALIKEANAYQGPVYLINGDSHVYNADRPLDLGSPWLATYGVTGSAPTVQRITVDGSDNNKDWLKVTVNKPGSPNVLSWQRVPYVAQAK